MKTITADELQTRVEAGEELNIIDVREADEVAAGMIPGAKHIPLGEVAERVGELDAQKEYHMVCRAGRRSEMACEILESNAIHTVIVAAVLTGSGGGIIRDLLAGRKPLVLKSEIYAVWAALAGLFIGFDLVSSDLMLYSLFVLITILRILSYTLKWRLPTHKIQIS